MLLAAQLKRPVVLLAWVARHRSEAGAEGACCDLDDDTGPFLLGALPKTSGLKMHIAVPSRGSLAVKVLTPYHILAVRGYVPPDRVNLAILPLKTAHRAACGTMPTTAAMACILACMRASQ